MRLKRKIRGQTIETYIPSNKLVVVLTADRSEVLLVFGECKALHAHLVQLHALQRLHRVKVPDDDVRLKVEVMFFQLPMINLNQRRVFG